jgi:hypothetical protein
VEPGRHRRGACAGRINGQAYEARRGAFVGIYAPGAAVVGPARSPATAALVRATSPVAAPALAAGVLALYAAASPSATPTEVREQPDVLCATSAWPPEEPALLLE